MKFLFAFALFILAGCLNPDPAGPGTATVNPKIEDKDLLSGATSSTNWPTDDAGSIHLGVQGRADSNLVLFFKEFLTPVPISGKVSFFLGGVIPAIDSLPTSTLDFENSDSLLINPVAFLSLDPKNTDTLQFNLRVEIDTAQCLIIGFSYSKKVGKFIRSPFSALSGASYPLLKPRYYYRGLADSGFFNSGTSNPGKTIFCFYIPGTPYFWKAEPDSMVEIGTLPFGDYPVRMLRIERPDNGILKDRLEIFRVNLDHVYPPMQRDFFAWKRGNSILTSSLEGSFSIRSKSP